MAIDYQSSTKLLTGRIWTGDS